MAILEGCPYTGIVLLLQVELVLCFLFVGQEWLFTCLAFFKKGLYLLYSLPLRSASFEWVLKKFPAFSPTQLARVECSYQFNARTLEMREQPWFGACSKFRLGFGSFSILALLEFGSWLFFFSSFFPPFFPLFFSPEQLSTHRLMLFILSLKISPFTGINNHTLKLR